MNRLLPLILVLLSIFINACQHKSYIAQPSNVPPVATEDTSLCFERDVLPVFISNCAKSGCHDAVSAQEGYVFTNYANIVAKKFVPGNLSATELYEAITEDDADKRMPPLPATALSAEQILLIKKWIERGAPNTTNCGSSCDSNNFTYANAIKPMLNKFCVGCHNANSPSAGYNFTQYTSVRDALNNNKLLASIRHESGASAMPQGGAKLSDCQIKQFEKWVESGAAEN